MELKREEEVQGTQSTFSGQSDQTDAYVAQNNGSEWEPYGAGINQDNNPYVSSNVMLSKQEFYKHPVMSKSRKNINACSIIIYLCAALTFLANVVLMQNIFGMLDVLLLVGLGLGIHLAKSRACASIILGYSVINLIFVLVTTGRLTGYLIVICGVYAVVETFKFQKAWNTYEQTGSYPGI